MISAVAFRKAQAAHKQSASPEKPSKSPKSSSLTPSTKPPSKRKVGIHVVQNVETPPKKKRKDASRPPKAPPTRYFEPQSFDHTADMIIVDSDSDDEEEVVSEAMEDLSVEDEDRIQQDRPWSPSAPIVAPDAEMPMREDINYVCTPQQNVFYLTTEEISHLSVPSQTGTVVVLNPSDKLCLLGSFLLTVAQGSVTLFGTTLGASRTSHKVYAPRSSPLPIIQRAEDGQSTSDASSTLPSRCQHIIGQDSAIIIIQDLDDGVRSLGQVCRTFEDVFEPRAVTDANRLRVLGVHQITQLTKDVQAFSLPKSWGAALHATDFGNTVSEGIHLVKGAKKSGKSTFARTLVNRLLQSYRRIAYLECDLGQSEFTPGGMVALNIITEPVLGPPFTHPALPAVAHYIGSTSPKSSPSHYLSAIQALLQTYRLDIQTPLPDNDDYDDDRVSDFIPLVVNSMGWTKGLGADLVQKIEEMLIPTHIYHFEAPVFEYGFYSAPNQPTAVPASDKTAQYLLEPIPTPPMAAFFTPADQRNMAIISYFYAIFPTLPEHRFGFGSVDLRQLAANGWSAGIPLSSRPPFEVDWTVAFDQIALVGAGMEDVVSNEMKGVLNGALIGLVACEPGSAAKLPSSPSTLPYEQGLLAPSPLTSCYIGLAFIRAVSPTSPHLQLITSAPITTDTRVIVKGDMEMPIWCWLDPSHFTNKPRGGTPFLQWGKGEGVGAEKRRVRRNLMRKAQM